MISINVRTDFAGVRQRLAEMQQDIAQKALVSAVNKTIDQAKTAMAREITAEFNLKSAYVKERLRVRRASAKQGLHRIEATLIGGRGRADRSANVIAFVVGKPGWHETLYVKIKRKGGKKPIAGAFIANKDRTVFERMPGTRMPKRSESKGARHAEQIKPVQTVDVAQMFNARRINAKVVELMREKFPEIFEREARFYLARFNAGR